MADPNKNTMLAAARFDAYNGNKPHEFRFPDVAALVHVGLTIASSLQDLADAVAASATRSTSTSPDELAAALDKLSRGIAHGGAMAPSWEAFSPAAADEARYK